MALASAKSSALEDNNKAVATGMKWSVEARAEIPQAMRDEIEAEMATKRVLRGGTEEDRMRARAETASLKKKVMDLRTPKNVKMPEPNDIVLIGECPWKFPRDTERIDKYRYRILKVDPKYDEINPKTGAPFDPDELKEAILKSKTPWGALLPRTPPGFFSKRLGASCAYAIAAGTFPSGETPRPQHTVTKYTVMGIPHFEKSFSVLGGAGVIWFCGHGDRVSTKNFDTNPMSIAVCPGEPF